MNKVSKETWLQLSIALATIVASAFVPEIRSFFDNLFKNIPVFLIVAGIVAIFYLQTRKTAKKSQKMFEERQEIKERNFVVAQTEWQKQHDDLLKKLNERTEHQGKLLENVLKTNALHLSVTKNAVLPIIYREHKEEVIKKLYYSNVQIPALQEHDFEPAMITEYQKFYHQKEVERYTV